MFVSIRAISLATVVTLTSLVPGLGQAAQVGQQTQSGVQQYQRATPRTRSYSYQPRANASRSYDGTTNLSRNFNSEGPLRNASSKVLGTYGRF